MTKRFKPGSEHGRKVAMLDLSPEELSLIAAIAEQIESPHVGNSRLLDRLISKWDGFTTDVQEGFDHPDD